MEFVFDPETERFAVGQTRGVASPHQNLAYSIEAGPEVVGGMFSRGPNGEIFTNEFSGHYWQQWTPEVRAQFETFLRESTGLLVKHTEGM